jgi:cyclic lactone autoinducer peptide
MAKKIVTKVLTVASALAMLIAVGSVAQACWFFVRQPDIPDGLKKFEE